MNRTDRLPEDIAPRLAAAGARLGPFARHVTWFEHVGSTNDIASRLAEDGAPEGTVVAADAQTAGRGRLGRQWASPAGAGLYVSAVLRPDLRAATVLTLAAGVAIAEGIEAATGLAAGVKWPNDLLVGGRKLAGILAERGGGDVDYVVLGFGINVMPAPYPPEVAGRATSIEGELGRGVDRGLILAECLASLAARYGQLRAGATDAVLAAWRRRASGSLNRPVEWERDGVVRRGVAQDVAADGALEVRTATGTERVISGEVRWI